MLEKVLLQNSRDMKLLHQMTRLIWISHMLSATFRLHSLFNIMNKYLDLVETRQYIARWVRWDPMEQDILDKTLNDMETHERMRSRMACHGNFCQSEDIITETVGSSIALTDLTVHND